MLGRAAPCEAERVCAGSPEDTALPWSANVYRMLAEGMRSGITVIDADYTVVMINPAQAALFGKSVRELVGSKCFREFEQRDAPCPDCPGAMAMATGQPQTAERQGVRGDGGRFYARVTVFPLPGPSGKLDSFIEVGEDVTEHKLALDALQASEAKHRALVETIPAITYIAALDEASTTLYVSPQVQTYLGFTEEDYKADPGLWRTLLHPDDRERVLREVAEARASGATLVSRYRMVARDGRVVWFRDAARLVRDPDGKAIFLHGVMYDVTETKEAEDKLRATLAELEQFNRLAVGRELRIIELKREVNQMAAKTGLEPPYDLSFAAQEGESSRRVPS